VNATVSGSGSVTVAWTPPAQRGAGILHYVVTAYENGDATLLTCTSTDDTPYDGDPSDHDCIVTGLATDTSYTFKVKAIGAVTSGISSGDSVDSDPSSGARAGAPSVPRNAHATAGSLQATVTWDVPTDVGAGITTYTVTAHPATSGNVTAMFCEQVEALLAPCQELPTCSTTDASTFTCLVTGLTSGVAYTFTVVANSLAGPSTASASSNSVTPGPPTAPTGVTAIPGNARATVSWVASSGGGGGILHYTATAYIGGSAGLTCVSDGPDDHDCVITGLANRTAYTFKVVANGIAATGNSGASIASGLVTPSAPPGPPTDVEATARDGQATVSWLEPDVLGDGIHHYTATARVGGQVVAHSCTTDDAVTTSCVVPNLTNGTLYTFTVIANGTYGNDSPPSAPSNAVAPGPPAAPTNVHATAGNQQAVVAWDASATTGAGIVGYTVTAYDDGEPTLHTCTTEDGTTLTCTVTGLTAGTAYTFVVRALGLSGDSGNSAPSTAVTPGPPSPPLTVTASAGNAKATVHWLAPSNVGAGVATYTVTAWTGGSATAHTCVTANLTCDVDNLTNGTAYTFKVTATGSNNSGVSNPGGPSNSVTPGPSGAPSSVTATPGPHSITVNWNAPTTGNGAGITFYRATATATDQTDRTCVSDDVDDHDCTINDLANGVAYTITVIAVGPGGNSTVGSPADPVRAGPPNAPTNVVGTPGNGSIAVGWTPPTNTGAGIAGYTATVMSGDQVAGVCAGTSGAPYTCTISSLTSGTHYTLSVVADGTGASGTSDAGHATGVITPGPPGAPTIGTATAGNGQVAVTWEPPSNVGAGIASYTVTAYDDGEATAFTCTVASATTCTVSGLTNATPYTFRVVANGITGTGTSEPSAATNAVTPGAAPGAPGTPNVTPGQHQITVTWAAPTDMGSGVTGYTVRSNVGDFSCTGTVPSVGCVVSGLTSGTQYAFTVIAHGTLAGDSPPSGPSAAVAPGPPDAPTAVTAVPGATSLAVSWTAPDNRGGGIAHYTATATPVLSVQSGGSVLTTDTCSSTDGSATSCTINGLTKGTTYTVTVIANGVGDTGDSVSSERSGQVRVGPPGVPTITAVSAGNHQATVTWSAPTGVGAGIASYTVTAYVGGDATLHTCTVLSPTSCTVGGLTNSTAYTFRVVANGLNGTGASDPSEPSDPVTPGAAPGAPGTPTATPGENQVTVTWSAPTDMGSGVSGYTVRSNVGDFFCNGTVPSIGCVISGLTSGVSYTFTVVAHGTLGGDSVPSVASAAVAPGPPDAPTTVTAVAGATSLAVSWTAPANRGGGIAYYKATASRVLNLQSVGSVLEDVPSCSTTDGSTTSCTINGLTRGRTYTVTVVAYGVGDTGQSMPSAPSGQVRVGPPGVPTITGVSAGNGQATVTWDPPSGVGADIASYTVTAYVDGVATAHTCTVLSPTSCTVTGLTNSTAYTFRVVANGVNGTGSSDPSVPSDPVTPGATPGKPGAPMVTAGQGQVTITWSAPTDMGSGVSGYTVRSNVGDFFCNGTVPSVGCVISGLTSGVSYTFTVVAHGTLGGDSAPSVASAAVAPGPPDAPTGVTAVAGASSLAVSWIAPTNRGGGIASYEATATPMLGLHVLGSVLTQPLTCTTTDGSTTSCTIHGLTPGTTYTVTVIAVGVGDTGESVAGEPSGPVLVGPPGAPTITSVTAGRHQATVTWQASTLSGSATARYTVLSDPGGKTCVTADALTLSCTVTGLTAGQPYTFTVRANGVGGAGDSHLSEPSTPAVVPGPPGAPTLLSVSGGDGNATAYWTAGDPGAGIDHFTVTASPGGASCVAAADATSCTIGGLMGGTQYTFTAVATGVGATGDSVPSSPLSITPTGAPNPATIVAAVAGDHQIVVSWMPSQVNGVTVDHYVVTATPGGATCTTPDADTTSCTFTDLDPGTPYTFTVVAKGSGGIDSVPSAASAPVASGPPDAPTAVMVMPGAGALAVWWTGPVNVGAGIASYSVTVTSDDTVVGDCHTDDATDTSCSIENLTGSGPFVISVVANGVAGTGVSGAGTTALDAVGPPGVPSAVTATPGNAQATVSWTASTNIGAGIAQYTVTSHPDGRTCSTPDPFTSSCTVTGLTAGQPYTFTVTAIGVSGTGDSGPSAPSPSVTPGPPGAPTITTAVAGDRRATVTWTKADDGVAVGHFTVVATPDGASCVVAAPTTHCTVTGLTGGAHYTFTVVATGAGGTGDSAPSQPSSTVTPIGAPNPPTAVTVVPGDQQFVVSWLPPTSVGAPIARYTATAAPNGGACSTQTGAQRTCTIGGLIGGRSYTVTVVATSTGGVDSVPSEPVSSVMALAMLVRGPIVRNPDGRQMVFSRATDRLIYVNVQGLTGGWTGWTRLGDTLMGTDPIVIQGVDGRFQIFAFTAAGSLWAKTQQAVNSLLFNPFISLGGGQIRPGSISVVINGDGRVEIIGRGTDQSIWRNAQTTPGGSVWTGWISLKGTLTTDPTVVRNPDGRLDVFAIGLDGATYHITQTTPGGSTWTAWVRIGSPVSAAGRFGGRARAAAA
jgi:titin